MASIALELTAHSSRQTSQVVDMSSGAVLDVCPGGVLVVAGSGFEAAVQDADEAVGELAEGGVVADVAAAELLVVGACAG